MRAGLLDQLAQPQLRGSQLELAFLAVLQELRRAQDRVDDRAQEGEDRGRGGARDQNRVLDPTLGVEVGPVDQRHVDDDQEENKQVEDEVQGPAVYSEYRSEHGSGRRVYVVAGLSAATRHAWRIQRKSRPKT
jgi:hypothetical protein